MSTVAPTNGAPLPYRGKGRISRRSISKHPNGDVIRSGIDILKGLLGDEPETAKNGPESAKNDENPAEISDSGPGSIDALSQYISRSTMALSLEQIRFIETTSDNGKDTESLNNTTDTTTNGAHTPQTSELPGLLAKYTTFSNAIGISRDQLTPVKTYLENFDSELSAISEQMENLQSRSNVLNTQLDSKRGLEAKLTPIVLDLAVPPDVVRNVIHGDVGPKWTDNIRFLSEKRQLIAKYKADQDYSGAKAILELEHIVNLLTDKCVERIRDFLIKQIKLLRVNGVPSQVVQNRLLEAKEIFPFLKQYHVSLANELKQAYVYTMRWYYQNQFSKYLYSLEKLRVHKVDKSVLLGNDEYTSQNGSGALSLTRTLFSGSATPTSGSGHQTGSKSPLGLSHGSNNESHKISVTEYLSLGKRVNILTNDTDETVLLAQIAENNPLSYWMETGFRSFNLALVDNGSVEYLFLNEFFDLGERRSEIAGLFEHIFSLTYTLGTNYTKSLVTESCDSYGILICIRLVQSLEYELQRRRIPVMENYLNLQLITLWPRFQQVIDLHCENMRRTALRTTSMGNSASPAPAQVTQHFGIFLAGLLRLSKTNSVSDTPEVSSIEPLSTSIVRLRNDFETALTKLSNTFGKNTSKKEAFLYNNYFLVLTILGETGDSVLAREQVEHFEMLTEAYRRK